MARQTGAIKLTGTLDDLCFYRLEGDYFVRRKSSLSGKRFWKDPVFAPSRRSAGLLQRASPLASSLYRQLPAEKKGRPVFRALTGAVRKLLAEGQTEAAVRAWFAQTYLPPPPKKPAATAGRPAPRPGPVAGPLPWPKSRRSFVHRARAWSPCGRPLPVLPSAGAG